MIITFNDKEFKIAELYQPLYKIETKEKPQRVCIDRWNVILQAEEGYNNNKFFTEDIVDWGSSLGYFSFLMAEKTKKTIYAIDHDINNLNLCREIQYEGKISNIDFIEGEVPSAIPMGMKSHLILSVLHHFQESIEIPQSIFEKIEYADTIYLELAHCNEWPFWAQNLVPKDNHFLSPFHTLKYMLEKTFKNFIVRLIGVHNTHIGSVRPLFQLKRKINEEIKTELFTGIIFDRFKLPYIDFGDFSLGADGKLYHGCRHKENITYAYALDEKGNKSHLKFEGEKLIKISEFIDGFLLSDIIKFGLLPYYDRQKLKIQLAGITVKNHKDPHPWNFIVKDDSTIAPIDFDSEKSSFTEECIPIYIQSLMQTI